MKKLHFHTTIDSGRKSVWKTMLDPVAYNKWACAFSPNSQFEGKWKQGAYVLFTDPAMGGTKALLEEVKPYERIHARHVAIITKEGREDTESDIARKWLGATETYTFKERDGVTELSVDVETHPDYEKMFNDGFPDALAKLKDLCEK